MMALQSEDLPLTGRSGTLLDPTAQDDIENTLSPSHSTKTEDSSSIQADKSEQGEPTDRPNLESDRLQFQHKGQDQDTKSNEGDPHHNLEKAERRDLKLEFAEPDTPLAAEQLKFCTTLIRNLKRLRDARPFVKPVDPVKLNIPTYFDVVKNPVDLSLIEINLKSSKYATAKEFMDDVLLVFDNCYLFNGDSDAVSGCAKNVEISFLKQMAKLPSRMPLTRKKFGAVDHAVTDSLLKQKRSSLTRIKGQYKSNPTLLKVCHEILKEVHKKQYSTWNAPFLYPVNPVALDIPEYYSIITHPIDLSTMRKKLDNGEYGDFLEFVRDFKLMFRNCYKFNAPGSHVYNSGKKLEEVFYEKVDSCMHLICNSRPSKMSYRQHRSSRSAYPVVDYSSSDDEEDSTLRIKEAQQFKLLLQQVQVLNSQIEMLREKRLGSTKKQCSPSYPVYSENWQQSNNDDLKPYQRSRKLHRSTSAVKQQRKKHKKSSSSKGQQSTIPCDEEPPLLTYAQKAELSNLVNNDLSSEALQKVMELIKSAPGVASSFPDQDEIELDIEQMDRTTLWKLYQFVKNPNNTHEDAPTQLCDGENLTDHDEVTRKHRQGRRGHPSSNSARASLWSNNRGASTHSNVGSAHSTQDLNSRSKDDKPTNQGRVNQSWGGNSASSSSSDYTSDTDYDNYSENENV